MSDTAPTINGSPVEEYERQQSDRRTRAARLIRRIVLWWLISYVFVISIAILDHYRILYELHMSDRPGAIVVLALLAAGALFGGLAGLAAFGVTLWHWNRLRWRTRLLGLFPWTLQLIEVVWIAIERL